MAAPRSRRLRRLAWYAVFGAWGLLGPASVAAAETRFVLSVGHNVGQANEVLLRWAESDARRFRQVLTSIGHVHPSRAVLLTRPTAKALREAWLEMRGRVEEARHRGERTALFFFYSGHADAERLHLGAESVSIADVERELRRSARTVVTIIDACRSRIPSGRARGFRRKARLAWPTPSDVPEGYVRLTSAGDGEVAQESDELQGGVFTHHLLSGLRGAADRDDDGSVTLEELYRFAYRETLEVTHRRAAAVQHSELDVHLSGRGALIVSYPKRADAALAFELDRPGRLLVVDDRSGRVVAEVTHAEERNLRLAVPAGRYRVHVRDDHAVRSGLVSVHSGTKHVTRGELTRQPLTATLTRGYATDPYPHQVFVGAAVRPAAVDGFGVGDLAFAPNLTLTYARRIAMGWRLGGRVALGYATANGDPWRHRQFELLTDVVGQYTHGLSSWLALGFEARAGVVGVRQESTRQAESVFDTPTSRSAFAIGPRLSLWTGAEIALDAATTLRAGLGPTVHALHVADSGFDGRAGIEATIDLGFRL